MTKDVQRGPNKMWCYSFRPNIIALGKPALNALHLPIQCYRRIYNTTGRCRWEAMTKDVRAAHPTTPHAPSAWRAGSQRTSRTDRILCSELRFAYDVHTLCRSRTLTPYS